MILYHGSQEIVEKPAYGYGNRHNDYGRGFYCTENIELAGEWSSREDRDGYVNVYELNLQDLTVLNLNDDGFGVLNWLTVLLENRIFSLGSPMAKDAKKYLTENFTIEYNSFDIIKGYRADDSYFAFAQDFLNGTISVRKLAEAMKLGRLGEQIVLKSPEAYDAIRYVDALKTDSGIYYPKRMKRDKEARRTYLDNRKEGGNYTDVYMLDILREEIKADDPRLR